jgi:oxygen-independent coproporphyrinogen III oxidase
MSFSSLYIHVPFCAGCKCDYCAFYSIVAHDEGLRQRYLNELSAQFRRNSSQCAPLRSIFIGGGTPGLLSPNELAQLCNAIRENFSFVPDCEWTIEANPESMTTEKIRLLAEYGVNRISFGVQSFQPQTRKAIGRRGTLDRLPQLVKCAHEDAQMRVNFDLIYACPGQTLAEWQCDLESALAYEPEHLSCYSLIIEGETPLAQRKPSAISDDLFLQFWALNDDFLGAHGLPRYEISNFADASHRCRHNWEIWHGQSYLGCGPTAVSFDGADRWEEPPDLAAWLAHERPSVDRIPPDARRREVFAFAFRTVDGWTWDELETRLALSREAVLQEVVIHQLKEAGMLTWDDRGIRATPQGLLYNDDLLAALL